MCFANQTQLTTGIQHIVKKNIAYSDFSQLGRHQMMNLQQQESKINGIADLFLNGPPSKCATG